MTEVSSSDDLQLAGLGTSTPIPVWTPERRRSRTPGPPGAVAVVNVIYYPVKDRLTFKIVRRVIGRTEAIGNCVEQAEVERKSGGSSLREGTTFPAGWEWRRRSSGNSTICDLRRKGLHGLGGACMGTWSARSRESR